MSDDTKHRDDTTIPRNSKRFSPSSWTTRLVPALLAVLLIGLVVTLLVVLLAMLGVTPGY